MPPVFPAHLILACEGPLLQESEIDSGKDIAAVGKVEDVAAADSVKDVVLFERTSEEPLPLEPADNVKELVALSKSTLLMSFNSSRITCSLLSTRASDVPQSPQSVRERSLLSNRVREPLRPNIFVGLGRFGKRP
jgi:hypothetical protein